ncbi:MAG: MaoC family dehydratase [Clostridiales bacterium]|nr:MaoC family dehydratase [Clostridiales bacterium]
MANTGIPFEEIQVGQEASFTKTITETEVVLFAGITGDLNPAHTDEVSAQASPFGGRVAHGALVASLFSTVLGMYLPGPGTIYLRQDSSFVRPVRLGDTVTATCRVVEKTEKKRVIFDTTCVNQQGDVVVSGQATVLCPRKQEEKA